MKYFKSLQFVNETTKSLEATEESSINDNGQNEDSSKLLTSAKKTRGRIKLKIEYMKNKVRRLTTFSKRKIGMMKKAYELAQLTGAQVMLLVGSETGHVYTFATDKLQPMVTSMQGKRLIESCLRDHDLTELSNSEPALFDEESPKVNDHPIFVKNSNTFNQLINNTISQDLLATPKGTLKKLYADIKQSKKGNCSMSINRHKIEHSPLKKCRNLLPQNIDFIASKQCNVKDIEINAHLKNNKLSKIYDNNVSSGSYASGAIYVQNNLNLLEQTKQQVMINQTVFDLIQTSTKIEKNHEELNLTSSNEAVNLIKNKQNIYS